MEEIRHINFCRVMDYPDQLHVFDLTAEYDPDLIASRKWGVGRYNEKRPRMYLAPQYDGRRNIHMGIDLWTRAGAPVYAFHDGEIAYMEDHNQKGNYGPTIVTRHEVKGRELYALHGHLSRESLENVGEGDEVRAGQKIATLGSRTVNGGWAPHLHFQLSVDDPGEADMPGVVSEEDREQALERYPDPRIVLGNLY